MSISDISEKDIYIANPVYIGIPVFMPIQQMHYQSICAQMIKSNIHSSFFYSSIKIHESFIPPIKKKIFIGNPHMIEHPTAAIENTNQSLKRKTKTKVNDVLKKRKTK
jgi:hypothetical protein